MTVAKIKIKAAWRENLMRNVKQGRTLTASGRLCGVGRAKIHQECRRDPAFQQELETALGHKIDSRKRGGSW